MHTVLKMNTKHQIRVIYFIHLFNFLLCITIVLIVNHI